MAKGTRLATGVMMMAMMVGSVQSFCLTGLTRTNHRGVLGLRGGFQDRLENVQRVRQMRDGALKKLIEDNLLGKPDRSANAQPSTAAESINVQPIVRLGFLGTGTIAKAVVQGLSEHTSFPKRIILSPRNHNTSSFLQAKYPDVVEVGKSNQHVVDSCDVLCLCVTPQVFKEVISQLTFREDMKILSFISTAKIDDILPLVKPCSRVIRAIPMPPIAQGKGPLPMFPKDRELEVLFSEISCVINLDKEEDFFSLMAASSLMAPFYFMQHSISEWMQSTGVPEDKAHTFVGELFYSLAHDSRHETSFNQLTDNSQTPGGINEQSLRQLQEKEFYSMLQGQLQVIRDRVANKATKKQ
eukprot:768014-Hanusia_phi.AAC.4